MGEEIRKISDPEKQMIATRENEENMRYHEMLEIDLFKCKTHLNFIANVPPSTNPKKANGNSRKEPRRHFQIFGR